MIQRFIQDKVIQSLADTPVSLIRGARQTGKTTLARTICEGFKGSRYVSLDDPAVLSEATNDPRSFVDAATSMLAIDEIQRAPQLLVAIKSSVDRDRRPGRFLLTGSADIMTLPRVAESLAGRMEVHTLHPLSEGEIEGANLNFIDQAFSGEEEPRSFRKQDDLWSRIIRGGFPEVLTRDTAERREAWFTSYASTVLQREVRDIANIAGLRELPRLLQLLAHRTATLMNVAELSRTLGIPHTTLNRYLTILESIFLFQPLPAWSGNMSRRLVRSSKVHLADAGLASHLNGLTLEKLNGDTLPRGAALENFVYLEMRKQATWSKTRPSFHYYRDAAGAEVDLLMEDRAGRIVAIEVKAGSSPSGRDFNALRFLAREWGDRLVAGYVIYTGAEEVILGPRLRLYPVSGLWAA